MQWTTTTIAILVTFARFYIRWTTRRRFQWDDLFHGFAIAFLITFTATWPTFGIHDYNSGLYALGLTQIEPPPRTPREDRMNVANTLIFWCVIYSVKASFLALYWPIFEVSGRFRVAWRITASYTAISFVITLLWSFWLCGSPMNFLDQHACQNLAPKTVPTMYIAWCILDLVGDALLIAIPMIMIRNLRMQAAQKIGLVVVFGVVLINILMEILRTIYSLSGPLNAFPHHLFWVFLQSSTAVVVCGLPCFGVLLPRKRGATPDVEIITPLQIRFIVEP
ncbi:hypothetical protein EJ04DRAFT_440109 [Polyplosphaeria fusca]|uniref:Rhodopsin domain-containing protein n=1 Tax=Polyplosphaeria fusca TaxID=682080 RepID=A0A9P4QXA3_9PLEO|nr:hypothetical protein EJ04DRAFT_440109 [Polyplosphaeria fusca]